MELDIGRMISLRNAFVQERGVGDDRVQYHVRHCLWAGRTRFNDVILAESLLYGNVLFLDGEMQSAESDEAIYHECLVHPALTAAAATPAKRVLVVGGGEGATVREVLKWSPDSVAAVDWVDIDGDLVNLCRRHLAWAGDDVYNDPRLTFHAQDIRTFLRSAVEGGPVYDVIILDLPDPDTDMLRGDEASNNALEEMPLHGRAFWSLVRQSLKNDGVLATHAGGIRPGLRPEARATLTWICEQATAVGFENGHSYHAPIPSFHSEWAFWVSKMPSDWNALPYTLRALDADGFTHAFHWPRYWSAA
jgi:spermidine synthase